MAAPEVPPKTLKRYHNDYRLLNALPELKGKVVCSYPPMSDDDDEEEVEVLPGFWIDITFNAPVCLYSCFVYSILLFLGRLPL